MSEALYEGEYEGEVLLFLKLFFLLRSLSTKEYASEASYEGEYEDE